MVCIFCDTENNATSIEHIVSESFGNKRYVMQKGSVCDTCNNNFSNFEKKALANSVFVVERARFGIRSKQGKTAKGEINNLKIEGNSNFRKNYLSFNPKGEERREEFLKNINPATGIFKIAISSFDKSEVATSKLILKIGLESIFTSQKKILQTHNFQELKNYLTTKSNEDWPFMTTDFESQKFSSVPTFFEKYTLKQSHCELKFLELNSETLLFKFKYGAIPITINLLNRNLNWIKDILVHENIQSVYPVHYQKKALK